MVGRFLCDIGRILCYRRFDGPNSYSVGDHRLSPMVPGAFYGIRKLIEQGNEIFFASKARDEYRLKDADWFAAHHFEFLTGAKLDSDHLFYHPERWYKAVVAKRFSITHVIDDRYESMKYLATVPTVHQCYLLNPSEEDSYQCSAELPSVVQVSTWEELLRHCMPESAPTMHELMSTAVAGASL